MAENPKCSFCGRWPQVADERFDVSCCAFCNRTMQWWADSYGTTLLSRARDKLRVWWIAETFYALRYGGPFDFWPWEIFARWICRWMDHEAHAVGYAIDNNNRRWFLFRCARCRGQASLEDGWCSRRAFRREVRHDSIYAGFQPLNPYNSGGLND